MTKMWSRTGMLLIVLALCLGSVSSLWAKEPLEGALGRPTEEILDNSYGFGLLSDANPEWQLKRESFARKYLPQDCEKYGPRIRPNGDCVVCQKSEQEVGLSDSVSAVEFQKLRKFIDEKEVLEKVELKFDFYWSPFSHASPGVHPM